MMRTLLISCSMIAVGSTLIAQTAFINEFDYDQPGGDSGEFVEVAIDLSSCPGGCDPTDFTVVLYNGNGNVEYDSDAVPTTVSGGDGAFTLYVLDYPSNGLQNGTPDGIALAYTTGSGDILLEFISYEGVMTAIDGIAIGITSTDTGVSETNGGANLSSQRTSSTGGWELSPPTKGGANNTPLPVALTAFHAKLTNTGAMLEWTTASEENNDYFAIEMSRDAARFSESAKINGNGTTESLETYTYEYSNLAPGTYYFRLRQVDFDGQYSYSDVVSLTVDGDRDFLMASNTVTDFIAIDVTNPRPARVLNLAGAVVAEFALTAGRNNLDVSGLAQGMYILSDGINAKRFVK